MDSPRHLGAMADAERERWGPWLAVAFGAGAATCFGLPVELPLWVGVSTTVLATGAAVWAWRRGWLIALLLTALAVAAAGFAAVQLRTSSVSGPILARALGPVDVEGRVEAVEPHDGAWRVTLGDLTIQRLEDATTPRRIRLRVNGEEPPAHGSRVRLPARLMPPPVPAVPAGFDFGRQAYFSGIGAVGFAMSKPELLEHTNGMNGRVEALVGDVRLAVTARLRDGISGAAGGVAAALVTGQRGSVPQDVIEAYRDSGLAHLLAISGLHMGLAAGLMFVTLRGLIALVPPLALRINGKKVAAVGALFGLAAYLALSGANVPAQRAFVMTSVILGAVLIDRSAMTFRVLATAAVVVLIWRPEAVVGPSFQLSFAAVAALVATYEVLAPRLSRWRTDGEGWLGPAWRGGTVYIFGILSSTVVSTLATAPYTAAHFGAIAAFGPAANLISVPLVALWVMPWLVAALLLMPFGLDWITFWPLRVGLETIELVARTVAGWPGAMLPVPPVPATALAVATLAGLWLCLWRRSWRLAAVPVLVGALVAPWLMPRPDILVNEDGTLLGVRSGPGMVLSPGRGDSFARKVWQDKHGSGQGTWTAGGLRDGASDVALACDARGCLYRTATGRTVALISHEAAAAEDCRIADVAVILVPISGRACRGPQVVTYWDLHDRGAHAITLLSDGGIQIDSVEAARGRRSWSGARAWDDEDD
ncbi:MAG: ComEC/Rec2 family competence protein [Rhodospirillaceae bacterium]